MDKLVIEDLTKDSDLKPFLENHLCLSQNIEDVNSKEYILKKSPILGPYIIKGRELTKPIEDIIRLYIKEQKSSTPMLLRSWGSILSNLSIPIAIICSAGASKAFVELIKSWVEERKGREIKIKYKDQEIILKGGITQKDIDRATKLFEDKFGKSKDIIV